MEAKKQFIIVPPMTEPLVKLNETYEAMAEAENLEITIIDDYLELSQYASFAGQCLIVFGNPKKCAHFLQENKILISKNKPKILLISPMDIPAATKEKFSKVGLTESLVESIPFKNLQFKVNMLLKSIKHFDNENPNKQQQQQQEHLVKSIVDTNHINSSEKLELKSKSSLNNLSGKSTYKEEAIDTHWSGQRNKKESELDKIEEGSLKVKSIEQQVATKLESNQQAKSYELLKVIAPDATPKNIKNTGGNPITSETPEDKPLDKSNEKLRVVASEKSKTNNSENIKTENQLILKTSNQDNPNQSEVLKSKAINNSQTRAEPLSTRKISPPKLEVEKSASKNNPLKKEANVKVDRTKIDFEDVQRDAQKDTTLKANEEEKLKEQTRINNAQTPKDLEANLPLSSKKELKNTEAQKTKTKTKIDEIIDGKLRSKEDGTVEKINNNQFGEYTVSDKTIAPTKKVVLKDTISDQPQKESKNSSEEKSISEDKSSKKKKAPNVFLTVLKKLGIAKNNQQPEDDQPTSIKITETYNQATPLTTKKKLDNQNEENPGPKNNLNLAVKKEIQQISNKPISSEVEHIDMYYRSPKTTDVQPQKKSNDSKKNSLEIDKKLTKKDELAKVSKKEKIKPEDLIIDYRQLKADFMANAIEEKQSQYKKTKESTPNLEIETDAINDLPIFEIHSEGLDFSIAMLNLVCDKNLSHDSLFRHISTEITKHYKGYATFYQFQKNENQYHEIFSSFRKDEIPHLGDDHVYWFNNTLNNEVEKQRLFKMTNTMWFCRELKNNESSSFWEDNELPNWASTELKNKKVELYFPYFDGVELLGCVLLYFPYGINSHKQHSILLTVEIAKSIFLDLMKKDSIEQSISLALHELELEREKKKLVGKITSILKKNKAS